MIDSLNTLPYIIGDVLSADIRPLQSFLLSNPSRPLVATGSGGSETAADLAALLYGARGGVATAVSPYTLNSFSDSALSASKVLLISKGGHNKDIVFAAKRALEVNPAGTAALFLSHGDRNRAEKEFRKKGSPNGFVIPVGGIKEGFVSTGTAFAYFALLVRVFQEGVDLRKYLSAPKTPYTLCLNDGTPLSVEDLNGVRHYIILQGGWGRPVAWNLEGKMVECGLAGAGVYDYRNYCHGRFIYTSNHLEDSAVVLLISPREKDIAERIRGFLPARTRLVIIESGEVAPETALDLLIRATSFYGDVCEACGVNHSRPSTPGRIDKRIPINIPFMATLKASGPLSID